MPICHSCQKECADFTELALHITSSKKGHRKGKKWAAQYLLKTRQLNSKKEFAPKTAMTDEQKETRRELRVELSGKQEMVNTICPKCKKSHPEILPVEHSRSNQAWRKGQTLLVLCEGCQGVRH